MSHHRLQHDAKQTARASKITPPQLVPRIISQGRVQHPINGVMPLQRLSQLKPVLPMFLQAYAQGPQTS